MIRSIEVSTRGQGLYEVTDEVQSLLAEQINGNGLCTLYIQHTSASLLIQENADPAVLDDLSSWFLRLVRENDPLYTHTQEGPDDMPAHIRTALTQVSLSIPVLEGRLALGTWQGIFLFEHRRHPHQRRILMHVVADAR